MDYIGIDIGGTAVKIGQIREDGNVICKESYPVDFDGYETPILATVLHNLEVFIKAKNIALSSLKGIGISATGQVDVKSGVIAGTAGHIKNWEGSKLKEVFSEKYRLPVTVINDADCAILAEKWLGGAKDSKDALMVTIGTGVGGGIISDSKILTGAHGLAGELGHFSINNEGRLCTCGNTGCYEQYASTAALVKMIKEADRKGIFPKEYFKDSSVSGKRIFELLPDQNPYLWEIYNKWLTYVAQGLVSLVHIFNPAVLLIGGGISVQEKLFIIPLRDRVLDKIMPAFRQNLKIEAAKLGNDAGMVGAVYYLMKNASQ